MNVRQYFRHFAWLVSAAVFAQIINLASYPFLTRLYTSSDFGTFAVYLSAVSLLSSVASGRFDLVIQVCRGGLTKQAFALAISINLGFSTFSVLVAYMLVRTYGGGDAGYAALLAGSTGLGIFLFGLCGAMQMLLMRKEDYRAGSIAVIWRTALTVIPQVAAAYVLTAYALPGEVGLILGFLIGYVVQAGLMLRALRRIHKFERPRPKRMAVVFRRYIKFVVVEMPGMLLASVNFHALNFFILYLYTPREVGLFNMGLRLIALPLSVLSESLSSVFLQKATKAHRENRPFWLELRFNLILTTLLAGPIFVGIILLSDSFIAIYFGPGWEGTADVLIALAPMIALRFISLSIAAMPVVIGRPHWLLVKHAGFFAAGAAAVTATLALRLSLLEYLWLNTALASVGHIAFIALVVRVTYRNHRKPRSEEAGEVRNDPAGRSGLAADVDQMRLASPEPGID